MDKERYQQIDALGISREEMEAYFELKHRCEIAKRISRLPLRVLYPNGELTNKIKFGRNPIAMKVGQNLFTFGVRLCQSHSAQSLEDVVIPVDQKSYTLALPNLSDVKQILKHLSKINEVIKLGHEIFGCKDNALRGQIWLRDKGKIKSFNLETETLCEEMSANAKAVAFYCLFVC